MHNTTLSAEPNTPKLGHQPMGDVLGIFCGLAFILLAALALAKLHENRRTPNDDDIDF